MRVALALLAEFAKVEKDGRFTITGGDIHEVDVGARYTLALAVRLELSQQDLGIDRVIEITSSGPDGEALARAYSLVVRGEPIAHDDRPLGLPFVYTMDEIAIVRPGQHTLSISCGGELLHTVSFDAIGIGVEAIEPEEPPWSPGMQKSYQAWEQHDLEGTVSALREVIDGFPDLAEAHNNLGFVLLMVGRTVEAVTEFDRAVVLDFDRPEIVLANLGICYYRLGDFDQALARFRYCLSRLTFIEGAWLLGLDDEQTFLQELSTAVDYVDLMTLNLGWTALRRNDLSDARGALSRSAVSTLRVPSTPFARSVENLASRLAPPEVASRA